MKRSKAPVAAAVDLSAPPITLRGVRTHNLKNVDCEFPAAGLTVVTGVSGSGKSSLAFDTLFAEGQRRYVESLSTYARQFLDRMQRPEADSIDHIPPAIALEQKNTVRNARSTVGTATEINDYLRLLFAKAGEVVCVKCDAVVRPEPPQEAAKTALEALGSGARVYILAPVSVPLAQPVDAVIAKLRKEGHTRYFIDGAMVDSDDDDFSTPSGVATIEVIIDRFALAEDERTRLSQALESAYRIAGGIAVVHRVDGRRVTLREGFVCNDCGTAYKEPEPRLFNFNNPVGACAHCQGYGRVTGIDWGKVVPNPALSMADGAIAPWNGETGREMYELFEKHNKRLRIPRHTAFRDLAPSHREAILHGDGDWPGVKGFFAWLEERRYKVQARIMLARYRAYEPCPVCEGTRLMPEAKAVRFAGKRFGELLTMSVEQLGDWFEALKLPTAIEKAVERPLESVRGRLQYLREVGLGYLTLARATRTLSGGESQRINLATALGSALTETLYVLDEPTVGLHARDTDRLVRILRRLVDAGNTVVLVEHDLDVMRAADKLIDIGPAAGERGGRVVFAGPPEQLHAFTADSATARFLNPAVVAKPIAGKGAVATNRFGRREPRGYLRIENAQENNLRNVTVDIPLGVLCCVTGVSGSGKSSLIKTCLYGNYRRERGEVDIDAGKVGAIVGTELISDMVLVDQSPIGRSTRSNAATFLKAYDAIRDLLATTLEAKRRGLAPRDFSFNVPGGRCETCEGTGYQTVEMLFLADLEVLCERCEGRRFQESVLAVDWNGLNVTKILNLTVEEALATFRDHRRIVTGLKPLSDVGLGYLRLGQSTSTLSGGEAQRLKIAAHLAEATKRANTLLLFDEPTTGLHPADLEVLLGVFDRLLANGFSLIVIEHNLELIRRADWLIDMGPEGGAGGGLVVAQGTPEEVAATPESLTGKFLKALRAG